jgi:hypothetical protein
VGTFGTLVGAGGGFVLVPVLLLLYPDRDPDQVTAMALFVVFANSASGSVAYARQGKIDYRSGLWFALGTAPGAVLGALAVGYTPRRTFDGIFAAALIAIAVYLIVRSRPSAVRPPIEGRGVVHRLITDRKGNRFAYSFQLWKGVLISGVVGFVSSLLGIGGGVVHVPVMATVLHFPVHIAAATSHFVLTFMSAEGTGVHIATGVLGWDQQLAKAALLALGAIPGAQVGALLSYRIRGALIIRALACGLMLVGARLAVKAITG